jgi:WD40 repeat protein
MRVRWQLLRLKEHTGFVCSVAFSPDGKLIASGSEDSLVKIWNAASGVLQNRQVSGYGGIASSLKFLKRCGEKP